MLQAEQYSLIADDDLVFGFISHKEFDMFDSLEDINARPAPFRFYTAADLWTDAHTSKKMLEYHPDHSVDLSSRVYSGDTLYSGILGIL